MFPSRGELHIALFNDEALYIEQTSKANFWCQESFHGVNLSSLRPQALAEIFKQPVVVGIKSSCLNVLRSTYICFLKKCCILY